MKYDISDREGYDDYMRGYESKTINYDIGFIYSPEKKEMIPAFVVDDDLFPHGIVVSDIASWNFNCNAISHHIIFEMSFENDRTNEKTEFIINLCPFELGHNKELKEKVKNIVGNTPAKTEMIVVGKKMLDALTGKVNLDPSYDRLAAHLGIIDLSPLVLTIISSELSYRGGIYDEYEYSKYCMYCRRHGAKK